jgi:hypothetical protein
LVKYFVYTTLHIIHKASHGAVKRVHPVLLSILAGTAILAVSSEPVMAVPQTITITSSGQINLPTVHKGDTINIEATLHTINDINEDGEGEPLNIRNTTGDFSFTLNNYAQPKAFSYIAPVDGQLLLFNIGGNDSDESASVTVDVNQKKRFTQAQKDAFNELSAQYYIQGGAAATAGLSCIFVAPPFNSACVMASGLIAGTSGIAGGYASLLGLDPSDPNFTQIAVPFTSPFTPVVVQPGITQGEADSMNALLGNQTEAAGLSKAIITSINRAQGAFEAGDTVHEKRQITAASKYSLKLSKLLGTQSILQANIKTALADAGFPKIAISPSDVLNFESNVFNNGLPLSLVQSLTNFGDDANAIEQIRQVYYSLNINEVAGSFPSNLANAKLSTVLAGASQALLDFALENAVPLSAGQEVKGEGNLSKPDGNQVEMKFEAQAKQQGDEDKKSTNILTVEGNLRLKDRASGLDINKSQVTRAVQIDNVVVVDGTYQAKDGSSGTFRIVATIDNQKRKKLTVSVSLSNGYQAGGSIEGEIRLKE